MPFTPYLKTNVGNLLLRSGGYVSPGQVYIGLATAVTDAGATVTEVSGGAYARQAISFDAPVDGVFWNGSDIQFPIATANWGTVVYAVLYDAITGGNPLVYDELSSPQTINSGSTYEILAGEASFSL